jgi:hypothetical protein
LRKERTRRTSLIDKEPKANAGVVPTVRKRLLSSECDFSNAKKLKPTPPTPTTDSQNVSVPVKRGRPFKIARVPQPQPQAQAQVQTQDQAQLQPQAVNYSMHYSMTIEEVVKKALKTPQVDAAKLNKPLVPQVDAAKLNKPLVPQVVAAKLNKPLLSQVDATKINKPVATKKIQGKTINSPQILSKVSSKLGKDVKR